MLRLDHVDKVNRAKSCSVEDVCVYQQYIEVNNQLLQIWLISSGEIERCFPSTSFRSEPSVTCRWLPRKS